MPSRPTAPVRISTGLDPRVSAFVRSVSEGIRKVPAVLDRLLTSKERLRLPKIRRSAEHVVDFAIGWAGRNPRYLPYRTELGGLRKAQRELEGLRWVQRQLGSAHLQVTDSIRRRETDLWMVAMRVYAMAQAQERVDENVSSFLKRVRGAMKLGPRKQRYVMAPVEPIPRSKKELKRRQLATARQEAGLPPAES